MPVINMAVPCGGPGGSRGIEAECRVPMARPRSVQVDKQVTCSGGCRRLGMCVKCAAATFGTCLSALAIIVIGVLHSWQSHGHV